MKSVPVFISDSISNMVNQIYTSITTPTLYDGPLSKRQYYLLYGQKGIGKEDQLLAAFNSKQTYKDLLIQTELLISADGNTTENNISKTIQYIYQLESNKQTANRVVLVVRNAHLLSKHLNNDMARRFALTFKSMLPKTYVVAISNDPPKDPDNNIFYSQFDDFVTPVLPTMDQMVSLYRYYFQYLAQQPSLKATVKVTEDDYLWLSQCSDFCTPLDIKLFMRKIYYYMIDNNTNENSGEIVIDRELLEDPDNKFMISSESGLTSITARDTRQAQQLFTTITLSSCVPFKPSNRKKRKIEKGKQEEEENAGDVL